MKPLWRLMKKEETKMNKIVLRFVGEDSWGRSVFKGENGNFFKDISCGFGARELSTANGGFDGEPDTPIDLIPKYQGRQIELLNLDLRLSKKEKLKYQMLDRLKSDCDYFLNFGCGSERSLWAGNVPDQIKEMKKIYNALDEKPTWLSYEAIEVYEKQMTSIN